MVEVVNAARARLVKGEVSLGMGIRMSRSVDIAQAMRSSDYDWLFIDLEHSPIDLETACQISVAALGAGIAPIVRVPSKQYWMATRVLDGGALGIVMPHVDSAAEAAEVVDHLKYPPIGHRSVAGGPPQLGFRSVPTGEATTALNAATLVSVMLETPQAIAAADAIAAVPGVDVLLIGTNDLTMELGIPGQLGHAKVVAAYETVAAACRKHDKWLGMGGVYTEDLMPKYIGIGARFVLAGADLGMLMAAASQRAKFLRGCK
ncbi:MAG TPA: aldolase/citrate lyase family protein [Candidatus Sulfotelmatobacter sp.]|nr:aldolase/citrate lyase family protein [Candidatus Sulfotelmatobacter sp.]